MLNSTGFFNDVTFHSGAYCHDIDSSSSLNATVNKNSLVNGGFIGAGGLISIFEPDGNGIMSIDSESYYTITCRIHNPTHPIELWKFKGDKKCKGVKTNVVKKCMTLEHYKDCLFNNTNYLAKFNTLRSRKHEITSECITKVALTANDDERYIIPDDPEHKILALGHCAIKRLDLYRIST